MPLNSAGLVKNIIGSVKNLGNLLGIISLEDISHNPQYQTILTDIDQVKSNWNKLPFPYTFSVMDEGGKPDPNFKDFELPLAPSDIQQTEEMATSITPSQGGTIVNYSTSRYKKLVISGTTGLTPFKGAGGVDPTTGEAIFQPQELKYRSGHEVFLRLRNYFKAYYKYKSEMGTDRFTRSARLIFKNYKDGEFLVVELINFDMKRNASKSFLYDYKLDFRVLGHFEFVKPPKSSFSMVDDVVNETIRKLTIARGIFLRGSDILKQIESTFDYAVNEPVRQLRLALKAAVGFVLDVADFPKKIVKSTSKAAHALAALKNIIKDVKEERKGKAPTRNEVKLGANGKTDTSKSDILGRVANNLPTDVEAFVAKKGAGDAILSLNEGLLLVDASQLPEEAIEQLNQEIEELNNLPKSYYESVLEELYRIQANAEDYFNLGSDDYDEIYDRTATLTSESTKIISDDELDILEGFHLAISAIYDILATTESFKSDFDDQVSDLMSRFDENELNLSSSQAVIQITVPAKTGLERLALNYLGDEARWPEIAELNDLQHPYITQDYTNTNSHIKKPGDTILIPAPRRNDYTDLPEGKEIPQKVALSKLERSLGTDLRLNKDFDLALDSSNEILLISGAENMGQAIVLKIAYEKDELLHAPSLGSGLEIGSKLLQIQQIKDNIIRTLNSDDRIDRIEDFSLVQDNSTISLYFNVKIKNIDIPVPMSVKI